MKVLLLGGSGRLGHKIAEKLSEENTSFVLLSRDNTRSMDAFHKCLTNQINNTDKVLILDVSLAPVTLFVANSLLQFSHLQNISYMVGTTDHSDDCLEKLRKVSTSIPVCIVPNFSKGILLLNELLKEKLSNGETFSQFAQKLNFTIKLTDIHHQHKQDAPSGTAKLLNASLKIPANEINSIREGEVVGTHTITLSTEFESLEITHKVTDRKVFAEGAYTLAKRFLENPKKPGMYSPINIF